MRISTRMLLLLAALGLFCGAKVATGAAANLAENGGFEKPDSAADTPPEKWACFGEAEMAVGVTKQVARSGEQSLRMTAHQAARHHKGLLQEIRVTPGKTYSFTAYVVNGRRDPLKGTYEGLLGIEWVNDGGKEIDRVESRRWNRDLSRMRWTRFFVSGEAPEGAVSAKFVIHGVEGDTASYGCCFIDDALIAEE